VSESSERNVDMNRKFLGALGVTVILGSLFMFFCSGCASRTRVTLGPAQVGGHVQLHTESQGLDFTLAPGKIGFTVGCFEAAVEGKVGPCEKIIGLEHSTGDPAKVFGDSD